mgnify:CR=1 FL=1
MLLFNDEDKRELLEEVPIYNVCDFLGIEYQNTGCRKSILCPDHLNHNDQHYGSCFIYENTNTAHCFVCNKSFDTIDLLRLNGYGYYDALCQLANLSGSLSRFEKQPDKKQFWLPNLTKEERESLWETFEKKLKTGTPVLIGVLNKKFLSVPIGTPISIAQQGKNRYETFIKEINCNNKEKCEWVISYRISYKNKVIREITCPMNWNYESEEAVLKELSYANFRCVKVSDTLLFARKK